MTPQFHVNFFWDVIVEAKDEIEAEDKAYDKFKEEIAHILAASLAKHCNYIVEEVD